MPPAAAPNAPLLLLLHGAGGNPERITARFRSAAEERGIILIAPKSAGVTWDAIRGPLGPDVPSIDAALTAAFDRCSIDPGRVAIGGFSDGASYALTLGMANGRLFSHVLAFSACIIDWEIVPQGRPRIFLSHGTEDPIMPIANCGRRISAQLRDARYEVRYQEFRGGHEAPAKIMSEGLDWFARR